MLQLHCPRCDYSLPLDSRRAEPRVCPQCASTAKVEVPLCATATLPARGSDRARLSA
jgi:hypothetical protein